jgi:hypothetical protein
MNLNFWQLTENGVLQLSQVHVLWFYMKASRSLKKIVHNGGAGFKGTNK